MAPMDINDVIITIMPNMFSDMAVALYMPTLNLAMHPHAGHGQHSHPTFSLLVTATMAHG